MNLLHITDLGNGCVQVSSRYGDAIPRQHLSPIPFSDPLNEQDKSELRWYLEEYLQFPYGAERWRAEQVERKMAEWGESLFSQIFFKRQSDPDPRSFYQEAVREGLEQCELCVSSEDPVFLNIPWELLKDPTPGRGYLAPSLAGLYRHRSGHKIEASFELSQKEPFRILLVIARPFGETDIPLRTVARPMLEALRPLRPYIRLDVLRPPTFDALQRRLNEQRGFYHLVHFDGHGIFARSLDRSHMQYSITMDKGHLVFETEDGAAHIVSAEELGQALATCKVPLFVLNACQSAEEGKEDPFSSVASQLIAIGAKGVLAMSYAVYASSAALFMQRFYEGLVNHASLSEAVANGRRRLYTEPEKASIIGPIALQDWMIPTLYQQEYRYIPIPKDRIVLEDKQYEVETALLHQVKESCPEGRYGFIGRDYHVLLIERALRHSINPWALLTGVGGIGKTELARGFARWYVETDGASGGVFAASFKEKADFGQVIGSVIGYGTDFSRLPESEQWNYLVSYLRDNPCLLVWDNFETVAGYPEGVEPLATAEEKAKLSDFLKTLKGGKSRILITTRKPSEDWLGISYELIEVTNLTHSDATDMARSILKTVGRRPEDFRDNPDYAELIKVLKGHPRSLEVVLPHLRNKTPQEIIEGLQERTDHLGESLEDASLGYALLQMSSRTRKYLPLAGLFVSYIRADVLAFLTKLNIEGHQNFSELLGETPDTNSWESALEEAGNSGLLRDLGSGIYEIPPTLPPFLRRQLVSVVGEDCLKQLYAQFVKLYTIRALKLLEALGKGDQNYMNVISIEEDNLRRALRLAEKDMRWIDCLALVALLGEFYKICGRFDEWSGLRKHLLRCVDYNITKFTPRDQVALWTSLLTEEAISRLERNELDDAEVQLHRVLDYLVSLNDSSVEQQIAVVYQYLGIVAQLRRQFDKAEQWYRKALEITKRLRLEQDVASTYHQLGRVSEERRQYYKAEQWYKKSMEIRRRHGLLRDLATDYHQLGRVDEARLSFDRAEEWYREAQEIYKRLGLEREMANVNHQLGVVAQEKNQTIEAEQWFRKALAVFERLGLKIEAADTYHHLGRISLERQRLDQAEQWFNRALEIYEHSGPERKKANEFHELGIVAQERGSYDEAEKWYRKALVIYEYLGLPEDIADEYYGFGKIAEYRGQPDQAKNWYSRALAIYKQYGLEDRVVMAKEAIQNLS